MGRHWVRVGVLLSLSCTGALAQTTTQEFAGHAIALQLPAGYQLAAQANPSPAMKTLGFATAPRADGTRGLIQVTLINFASASNDREPALDEFAAAMIGGVHQRRSQWFQAARQVDLGGVQATRIMWSGSTAPSSGTTMHGVMIVGIKDHIGFSLHTQDLEPFSATTVPQGEQALMTFTLQTPR